MRAHTTRAHTPADRARTIRERHTIRARAHSDRAQLPTESTPPARHTHQPSTRTIKPSAAAHHTAPAAPPASQRHLPRSATGFAATLASAIMPLNPPRRQPCSATPALRFISQAPLRACLSTALASPSAQRAQPVPRSLAIAPLPPARRDRRGRRHPSCGIPTSRLTMA